MLKISFLHNELMKYKNNTSRTECYEKKQGALKTLGFIG